MAIFVLSRLAAAQDAPPGDGLTQRQTDAIGLITYLQVARRACGYTVETEMMSVLAREGDITLQDPAEQKVAAEKLVEHYEKFSGVKQVLECGNALDQFGPEGKTVKGLLRRLDQ